MHPHVHFKTSLGREIFVANFARVGLGFFHPISKLDLFLLFGVLRTMLQKFIFILKM